MGIEGWFDGSHKSEDGQSRIGIGGLLKIDGKIVYEFSEQFEGGSVNSAEYSALLKLLEYIRDSKITEPVLVRGDSQLVIRQMTGQWNINEGVYVETALAVKKVLEGLKNVRLKWTARDNNKEADKLSKIK